MKTKLNFKNRGFTIIEVMIVLAIAGLILAVILLAVPALQRSQRNNARTSDATHLAGLVGDYVSNHGGKMPTGLSAASPCVNANVNVCTNGENFNQLQTQFVCGGGAVCGGANAPSTSIANIVTDASCNTTTNALSGQTGAFAIVWMSESPGGTQQVCLAG